MERQGIVLILASPLLATYSVGSASVLDRSVDCLQEESERLWIRPVDVFMTGISEAKQIGQDPRSCTPELHPKAASRGRSRNPASTR